MFYKIYNLFLSVNPDGFVPLEGENLKNWFQRIGFWFENLFGNIVARGRAGISALSDFTRAYEDMFDHLFYLNGSMSVSPDGTKYLSLEPFIANFRYFTGDLIFTEIYCLLMCAAGFLLFQIVFKVFEALKNIRGVQFKSGNSFKDLFSKFFN